MLRNNKTNGFLSSGTAPQINYRHLSGNPHHLSAMMREQMDETLYLSHLTLQFTDYP
jgi:hypothetical protein